MDQGPESSNYYVYELELTACSYAVNKCARNLHGHTFTIMLDHKALKGLENTELEMIKNPRVVRLMEDLMGFNFQVDYIQGAKNILADYLSRHPNAGEEAPFYPRLMKPSLFSKSGHVNRVSGGEVVDLILLRIAEMG